MGKHNSGSYYVKVAESNGLTIKPGKGDHVNIYAPAGRGYMTVPLKRELATGTECAVKKWFKALGILLTLVTMVLAVVVNLH
jgi:hypothetical protein